MSEKVETSTSTWSLSKLCRSFSAPSLKRLKRSVQCPALLQKTQFCSQLYAALKRDKTKSRHVLSVAVRKQIGEMLDLPEPLQVLVAEVLREPDALQREDWVSRLHRHHESNHEAFPGTVSEESRLPEPVPTTSATQHLPLFKLKRDLIDKLSPLPPPPSARLDGSDRVWIRPCLSTALPSSDAAASTADVERQALVCDEDRVLSSAEELVEEKQEGMELETEKLDEHREVQPDQGVVPGVESASEVSPDEDSDSSEFELVDVPSAASPPDTTDNAKQTLPNLGALTKELAVDMAPVVIPGLHEEGEIAEDSMHITRSRSRKQQEQPEGEGLAKKRKHSNMKKGQKKKSRLQKPKFPRPAQTTFELCSFWMNKLCKEGDLCRFAHEGIPQGKQMPCKYFRISSCSKGDSCPYSHDLPCKFFHLYGGCTRTDCRFTHTPLSEERLSLLKKEQETRPEVSPGEKMEKVSLVANPFKSVFDENPKVNN